MIPGEVFVASGDIDLNAGRRTVVLKVANTGDRPIQVGSHYHFAETNSALSFDRAEARGFRLNIAAGTAVRFEPGQSRTVELVALAGDRIVFGFVGAVMGPLDAPARTSARRGAKKKPATKRISGKKRARRLQSSRKKKLRVTRRAGTR